MKKDESFEEKRHYFPIEGVEIWQNPKNKFWIFQLHYSANENKRDDAYRDEIKSSMPIRQYMQEYELQWDSYIGLPVYADWNEKIHLSKERLTPQAGLPLIIGLDFGLTPAAVIGQLQENQLVILHELVETNMGIERFSDKLAQLISVLYPEWNNRRKNIVMFIDPAGTFRKDTDEGTCAKILDSKGFNPLPGPVSFEERKRSVEHFLTRVTKSGPCFKIDAITCPTLVRGFNGGYRYPEKSAEIEPHKIRPLKDFHSHCHDALQYMASGVLNMRQTIGVKVPRLVYGSVK